MMCFHTTQVKKVEELEKRYNVQLLEEESRTFFDQPAYHLNGFVHPLMLIIPQQGDDILAVAKWGLAPSEINTKELDTYYHNSRSFGSGLNARSERLFDHFLYREQVFMRRCLVPVTGFFEPHEFNNQKYPYLIQRKDRESFCLGGIYTLTKDGTPTFAILTKSASPYFAHIHNRKKRQPVLISPETENRWLKEELSEMDIQNIISSDYDDAFLQAYTVSRDLFMPHEDTNVPRIQTEVAYPEMNTLF